MSNLEKTLRLAKTLPKAEVIEANPELLTPELIEKINKVNEGLNEWGKAFFEWLRQGYDSIGAPYGQTDEGV